MQGCLNDIFDTLQFADMFHYSGDDLGAVYSKNKTTFRLWAPTAEWAKVLLYRQGLGGQAFQEIQMCKDLKGTWVVSVGDDLKGVFYTYKVLVNGSINEAVDPYAKAVGANGLRGMIVDLADTDPDGWQTHKKPEFINFEDAIIYELHIRDLSSHKNSGITHKGKFLGLTEKGTKTPEGESTGLDHLIDLGITHLHLLPVFDFLTIDETKFGNDDYNWGYDPQNYNVPEGSYSTDPYSGTARIYEFKQMVKTLHENGIRVVMDVVYNHTAKTEDSHLNLLVPGYYYRKDASGNFSNGSGCGNEIASERFMARKLIVDSVKYWAKEYKIDGFRFDLMALLDIDTMNHIRAELDKIDKSIIIYGEGWTGGASPLPDEIKASKFNICRLPRIAVFSDDMRDAVKGSVFLEKECGFANGGQGKEESIKFGIVASTSHPQIDYTRVNYSKAPWACDPGQTINYVSSHDNHTLWDKIYLTNPYETEEERIKINKLCCAIILTSQGIPFIHAGEEILRTKNFHHNSYNAPDSINQLDWSRKHKYRDVYEYYKGLIRLRKNHPAFRMTTAEQIQKHLVFMESLPQGAVGYTINNNANGDRTKTIAVILNAGLEQIHVELPGDEWAVVVDENKAGDEVIRVIKDSKVRVAARSAMVVLA